MSETADFSSDNELFLGIPPSSRATLSETSSVLGNPENPIDISDEDEDEEGFWERALEHTRETKLLKRIKEEPKQETAIPWAVKRE